MTRRMQVYECRICHGIVEVLQPGGGGLSCCGAAMKLFAPNRPEASWDNGLPLLDLSEVRVGGQSYWQFLSPGETPEPGPIPAEDLSREYGNWHGLGRT